MDYRRGGGSVSYECRECGGGAGLQVINTKFGTLPDPKNVICMWCLKEVKV